MASPPCPHGIEETETTPLLRTRSTTSEPVSSWGREAKIMALWSAPLMLTQLLQRSITFASVFAVGRIGKVELGAVSGTFSDWQYVWGAGVCKPDIC